MSNRLWRASVMFSVVVQLCLLAGAQSKPALDAGWYKNWLNEDVRWIITDEERAAFKQLSNDEERDQFIEIFWRRRDPTPDTFYNELKVEHYRRIVAANDRFRGEIPGWKSDRGRIYILYGPPDRVESIYVDRDSVRTFHLPGPTGPPIQTSIEAGSYRAETWSYRYLENVGQGIRIYFVDVCSCGNYQLAYADAGTMGADRSPVLKPLPPPFDVCGNRSQRVEGIQAIVCGVKVPGVRFRDLEELVVHQINVKLVPFGVWTDSIRATCCADLVTVFVELRKKDITMSATDKGTPHGMVNLYGRLVTQTGRVAEILEDSVNLSAADDKAPRTVRSIALAMRPGRYRLELAVQDIVGDRVGTLSRELVVPEFDAPTRP